MGQMAPWSVYSSSRFLFLKFTTDHSVIWKGFAAGCRATTQRYYNFSSHQEPSSISLSQTSTMSISSTPLIHGQSVSPSMSASVSPPTSLRLVGGNWNGEGRVEIFHNGYWGTVCDDIWGIVHARVVCRELGYPDALSAPGNAYFGLGNGHIWLDNVQCLGHESSIVNCQHNGWGSHNCVHSEDASVICSANYSTSSPNGITPTPVPSSASFSSSFPLSECSSYTYLEDSVRGQGFYNGYYGFYQCDSSLPFGWYRFRGAAGTQMPTSCVGKNRCSSHAPGWLNTTHPSVDDGIVNAIVCFHWSSGCCHWTKNIRVRNCSEFYVYELGPTPTCWLRYCGNGGANYSASSSNGISSTAAVSASSSLSAYATFSTSSPNDITPTPAITSSASYSSLSNSSACSSYTYLEDSVRAQGFYNGYYGFYQCDNSLPFGWYRFRGAAGTQMPTTCVGKNRCSSHAPGWLSAPHPSVDDGIVNAIVCFHWSSSCCHLTKNIRVRNCSGFYVYELGPTPGCWLRYCGNGGANLSSSSSDGISSTAGAISPTSAVTLEASSSSSLPVHECYNHAYLEDFERGQNFYNGYYGYYQCDNNLPFGWYRFRGAAGNQMPTQCVGENRCSSHGPGWLSTPHPSVADGIISATVCFHWRSCCSWSINIRVRNCSGFYVYELRPTQSCYYRYCGNGGANFSTSSFNGISSTAGAISPTPASYTSSSSVGITLTSVNQIVPTSSSSMSSIRYASSSSYALPTPVDFQLHVPADCAHICANTPGSYICSCVSGYRLAADGKSCLDIDECFTNNGGCSHRCYNIPGSFYCGCPEGTTMAANNLTCIEPGVTVTCDENNMTVSLEKQTFPFFQVGKLHLLYSSCRATANSTHFLISTPLNGCGTLVNETEETLVFFNKIIADAVVIDNVITRTHDIRLPFYCSYSRRKMLSLTFKPKNIIFGHEAGYGNFTFRMDFYHSAAFETPYTEKDYPIQISLNEYLYVKYSVESRADLVIMAENCKATKDGSYHSWPQHNIIQNGCPQDSTMDYSYDPSRSYQQFKIRTFRFFNDYDTVYFHCEVLACNRYSPNSRCSRSCLNNKRRKRRDVTRDDVEHQESTTKKILTGGPIKIAEKRETGDTGQSKQAALIGGAAAAGGFGLIAAIALAVLFVKYRIARRFMNRNKVGDLYTTKEEQMSRKNAYIQEDDMIEKEDSF